MQCVRGNVIQCVRACIYVYVTYQNRIAQWGSVGNTTTKWQVNETNPKWTGGEACERAELWHFSIEHHRFRSMRSHVSRNGLKSTKKTSFLLHLALVTVNSRAHATKEMHRSAKQKKQKQSHNLLFAYTILYDATRLFRFINFYICSSGLIKCGY